MMLTASLAVLASTLATTAAAAECALTGYYFKGQTGVGGGGGGNGGYSGNNIQFFVDGKQVWDYNSNHGLGDVAAICAGNNQPGDKCRHGVTHNGQTYYYSVDFQGTSIRNCLVEWNGQGHWADQDTTDCYVDSDYTFIGIGGGPTGSCGCKWQC